MQALEKNVKHSQGCKNICNSTDGADIYETIIDYPTTLSSLGDGKSIPKLPVVSSDFNPYDLTPKQNRKGAHTDFNQEPPTQYTTLQHMHISTSISQEASQGSSQYQQLMGQSEIPAYAVLQSVQRSDSITVHKEGEEALQDDQGKNEVGGSLKESGYAALLTMSKTDEDEYASITIKP